MDQKKLKSLILSAMMAALVCAATMAIQIPSPTNGYVNLGDCFVLLCGFILNPWSAFAAAGIGSALADLLSGYPHYAVATFLIKGCVALCAYILNRTVLGKNALGRIGCGILSEIIMIFGYFGFSALIRGKGLAAAASIPGNIVQALCGVACSCILIQLINRYHLLEHYFKTGSKSTK